MQSLLEAVGLRISGGGGVGGKQRPPGAGEASRKKHNPDSICVPLSLDQTDVVPNLVAIAAATEPGIMALEAEARGLEVASLPDALSILMRWTQGLRRRPRTDESLASFKAEFLRSNALEKCLEYIRHNEPLRRAVSSGAGLALEGPTNISEEEGALAAEVRSVLQLCLPRAAAPLVWPVLRAVPGSEAPPECAASLLSAVHTLKDDWQEVVRSHVIRSLERRLDSLEYDLQKNGVGRQAVGEVDTQRKSHNHIVVLATLCESITSSRAQAEQRCVDASTALRVLYSDFTYFLTGTRLPIQLPSYGSVAGGKDGRSGSVASGPSTDDGADAMDNVFAFSPRDGHLPNRADCEAAVSAMLSKEDKAMRRGLQLLGLPDAPLHFVPGSELILCGHDVREAVNDMMASWMSEEVDKFYEALTAIRRIVGSGRGCPPRQGDEAAEFPSPVSIGSSNSSIAEASKDPEGCTTPVDWRPEVDSIDGDGAGVEAVYAELEALREERAAVSEERRALLVRLREFDARLQALDERAALASAAAGLERPAWCACGAAQEGGTSSGGTSSGGGGGGGRSAKREPPSSPALSAASSTAASSTAELVSTVTHAMMPIAALPPPLAAMGEGKGLLPPAASKLAKEILSLVEDMATALAGDTQRFVERLAAQLQQRRLQLLTGFASYLEGELEVCREAAAHGTTGGTDVLDATWCRAQELCVRVEGAVGGGQGEVRLTPEVPEVGARCRARWMDGELYDAEVQSVLNDGTVVLNWLRPRPAGSFADGSPMARPLVTVSERGGDDSCHRMVAREDVHLVKAGDPLVAQEARKLFNARSPEDTVCIDCNKSGTNWASVSFGIYLCESCAQVHRELGKRCSLVRLLDDGWGWRQQDLEYMRLGGNAAFRASVMPYPMLMTAKPHERYPSRFAEYYRRRLDALCMGAPPPQPLPVEIVGARASGDFLSAPEAVAIAQEVVSRFEAWVSKARTRLPRSTSSVPSPPERSIASRSRRRSGVPVVVEGCGSVASATSALDRRYASAAM